MIKKVLGCLLRAVMSAPRKAYYKRLQKKLKNSNFSIIASDCLGGFIYHNLNQKFNSPTINLSIPVYDFLQFVSYLKEYLSVELVEVKENDKPYPVGSLTYNGYTVYVHFIHYHSFEEAKAKWDERKQRVNFSNIYILMVVGKGLTSELLRKFETLPYEHKLLVAHNNEFKSDCMVTNDVYTKKDYRNGDILWYKSVFSVRRYMDDIDYVGFLNNM